MFGLLPPSSSVTRFSWSAQVRMMSFPISFEPVKLILSTRGWVRSGPPASGPRPVTTLSDARRQARLLADAGQLAAR